MERFVAGDTLRAEMFGVNFRAWAEAGGGDIGEKCPSLGGGIR